MAKKLTAKTAKELKPEIVSYRKYLPTKKTGVVVNPDAKKSSSKKSSKKSSK